LLQERELCQRLGAEKTLRVLETLRVFLEVDKKPKVC
jgi:hypothetical protein